MKFSSLLPVELKIQTDINSLRKHEKTASVELHAVLWTLHTSVRRNSEGADEIYACLDIKYVDKSLEHKFETEFNLTAHNITREPAVPPDDLWTEERYYGTQTCTFWAEGKLDHSTSWEFDLSCFDDNQDSPILFTAVMKFSYWEICPALPKFDFKNEKLSDFKLIYGGKTFYISKYLILQHSEKFREETDWQEQLNSIDDCDSVVFRKFLAVLLGYKVLTISIYQFLEFAELSLKFGFKECLKHCEISYIEMETRGDDEIKTLYELLDEESNLWNYCKNLDKKLKYVFPVNTKFEKVLEINSTTQQIEKQICVTGVPFHVKSRYDTENEKLIIRFKCLYKSPFNIWKLMVTFDYNEKRIRKKKEANKKRQKLEFRDCSNKQEISIPFTHELRMKVTGGLGIFQETSVDFNNHREGLTDIVFSVGDKKFHVSKQILANASPYFYAYFYGAFAEKDKTEILLEDIDENDYEEFLQHIYSPKRLVKDSTVNGLLHLLQSCDVPVTRNNCAYHLRFVSKLSTIQKMALCAKYSLNDLFNHLASEVKTVERLSELEDFAALDEETQNLITTKFAATRQNAT